MNGGNRNYQKELDKIIDGLIKTGTRPKLLMHTCCAPCSSYCLKYLSEYFDITVYYYNPNITEEAEYRMRTKEQKRLIDIYNEELSMDIKFVEGEYDRELFLSKVKGYEACKEGGDRCKICFELRLDKAGTYAKNHGFDFFTTSLTISPLKNAPLLNSIGEEVGSKYDVRFLPSDFKKKEGYKQSIELSKEYGLYRQNYCGCVYSKNEMLSRQKGNDNE